MPPPASLTARRHPLVALSSRTERLAPRAQARLLGVFFSDVKTPTGSSAEYKQAAAEDLGRMGLIAWPQGTFYRPTTGRDSERRTMAVVAKGGEAQQTQLRYVVSAPPEEGGRHPALGFYPIFALSVFTYVCAFWLRANIRAWTGRGPRSSDRTLWSCHLPGIMFTKRGVNSK